MQKSTVVIVSLQVQTSYQAVPLGAACIVSSLRSDSLVGNRAEVKLADFSLESPEFSGLSPEDAGRLIARRVAILFQGDTGGADGIPPVAGFSVYVWNRTFLAATARELRTLVPGIILFAGGPEVTASPESFGDASSVYRPVGIENRPQKALHAPSDTSSKLFDYLVCGEGETACTLLVRSILDRKPVPREIAATGRAPDEDCALLSSPWLDGTLDSCESVRDFHGALWELARGCPYNCAYCYESKGSKKVRTIPLSRLEKELDHFVHSGTERVFVLDPTYNASRDRALSLLRLIEKKAPEIHFNFEVRAEHLDRELADAFSKIPCSLQIGLQSSNAEALKLVNRPVDIHVFSKKIGLLNDAGVVFGLDLMYGLPGDSLSGFRASLDYAISLYPNNLEIFRLAVLPGTALADRAASLGLEYMKEPPYHILSTQKFPPADLERAATLARACEIFYTQGRAVSWFLSALSVLKLKPSQFLQDFSAFLTAPGMQKKVSAFCACPSGISHPEAERLQLDFLEKKFAEKGKSYVWPAVRDIVRLNGAWTRALAEGDETVLDLSYRPDDLFSSDAMDPEYFSDNAYMEQCSVRVFPTPDGPDFEFR